MADLERVEADLHQIGISGVAPDTLKRACEQLPAFAGEAAAAAAMWAETGEETPEFLAAVERIGVMLRAASAFTAEQLAKLGLEVAPASVCACAQSHLELFRLLAAYSKGNEEAGQRALQRLMAFVSPVDLAGGAAGAEPSSNAAGDPLQEPASLPAPAAVLPEAPQPMAPSPATAAASAPDTLPAVPAAAAEPQKDYPEAFHIYGLKGALTLTIEKHPRSRQTVLMIDAASASGHRTYDWRGAITMMLSINEAILLFAVLCGLLPSVETAARSRDGKRLKLEDQGGNFYLKLTHGPRVVAVPITPLDALQLALRISRALVEEHPHLKDMPGVLAFVQPFIARLASKPLYASKAA